MYYTVLHDLSNNVYLYLNVCTVSLQCREFCPVEPLSDKSIGVLPKGVSLA